MKKYIKKYMIACIVLLLIVVLGYLYVNSIVDESISVSFNNRSIDLVSIESYDNVFVDYVNNNAIIEIPYDTNLLIDFHDMDVDSFEILDYLLDSKGQMMFTEKEISKRPVMFISTDYYLTIEPHLASLLNSTIEPFYYRGIEMIVTSQGVTQSYIFVFKTEPRVIEVYEKEEILVEDERDYLGLVFEELLKLDPGLNSEMTYIAISDVINLNDNEKESIEAFLQKYQVPIIYASYETLKESNLIIDDAYLEGILLEIESIELQGDQLHIIGSKYKSVLGAIGVEVVLKKENGSWQVISSEISWIS